MLRRFTSRLPAIAMAGLLILGLSERAHANLQVTLNGSSSPINIGNTQFQFNLAAGGVNASGTATGEVTLGIPASMDLSALSITTTGPANALLIFSENNINSPTGKGTISEEITGHFLSGVGNIAYQTFGSNSNTLFTTNGAPGDGATGTVTSLIPPNNTSTGAFNATAPYSLTEVLMIHFTSAGVVSLSSDSSARFSAVPEPSSMAMAGLGALGFIAYGLRRRKASGA
jgi:PEP-CTERM motif